MLVAAQKVASFINYWWFRYLMMTELYMVEKWERVLIHAILLVFFLLCWAFNYSVLLNFTGNLFGGNNIPDADILHPKEAFISPQFHK